MTEEAIPLEDFPPFIRFELKDDFRREIFSTFAEKVGEAAVDASPGEFWRSVEEEFGRSRYELIFGTVRGRLLKTLAGSPLSTKEILERTPEISMYSIYHALSWLTDQKLVRKMNERWAIKNEYFKPLRVSDLAKITDLRHNGMRRRNALSVKDLEMATYLWPRYERVSDYTGVLDQPASYGRWYQNQFALARAVKEWADGAINIPQWALMAIADLAGRDIDAREAISSYSLPPGVKITPYYKGGYKIPVELSPDFDLLALRILMKSDDHGLIHPAKDKKAIFERLHLTFGSFQSNRVPLSIREIIATYYHVPLCSKNSFRIPEKMKERWEKLPEYARTRAKISVLEMLFDLDQPRRTYELISRSKAFLEDVASIMRDLGIGDMNIHKRKDRPHYRAYLPKKVKENLKEFKKTLETVKIEKGIDFLSEEEREELISKVRAFWGDKGVEIVSNLTLDKGLRDLDLARASGVMPPEVRRILYELGDRAIITCAREESHALVEYYYSLSPEGIKRFLGDRSKAAKREEGASYPFPKEFTHYQRRKLFSGVG